MKNAIDNYAWEKVDDWRNWGPGRYKLLDTRGRPADGSLNDNQQDLRFEVEEEWVDREGEGERLLRKVKGMTFEWQEHDYSWKYVGGGLELDQKT